MTKFIIILTGTFRTRRKRTTRKRTMRKRTTRKIFVLQRRKMRKNSTAAIIAVYLCTTLTYVCDMPSVILALLNRSFPGQEAAVTLILTLPSVVGMVTSFAMAPCLLRFSGKILALISVACAFASGMVFLIGGSRSIGLLLFGSVLIGITAGSIPSITNTLLTMYSSPENRARLLGLNVSIGAVGNTVFLLLAGVFSRSGNWVRAYFTYFAVIPIFLFVLWKLPYDRPAQAAEKGTEKSAAGRDPAGAGRSVPRWIIPMFVSFLLFACAFYIWTLRYSSYIITEYSLGTSLEAGMVSSTYTVCCILAGIVMPYWARLTRRMNVPAAMLVTALAMLVPTFTTTSLTGMFVSAVLLGFGATFAISSSYSVIGLTIPEEKTGFYMSLFNGGYNLGKFCSPYFSGAAVAISGTFLSNYLAAAAGCAAAALIGFRAYFAAYRKIHDTAA